MKITIEIESVLIGGVGDRVLYMVRSNIKHGGFRASTERLMDSLLQVAEYLPERVAGYVQDIADDAVSREEWAKRESQPVPPRAPQPGDLDEDDDP